MKVYQKAIILTVLVSGALLLAGRSWAGEITGTVSVPTPKHAVVFIKTVPGHYPPGHAEMDQLHKTFIPYVVPVVQGSTVTFHNSDHLQHNVFGVGADNFNLGSYGFGASRGRVFNKGGEVDILCNIHNEMAGYILVLQNPYFAQPDSGGKFRIANIPAGDYTLIVWYETKIKKQNVTVPAKGDASVSFSF